jgi:hypothetical protein
MSRSLDDGIVVCNFYRFDLLDRAEPVTPSVPRFHDYKRYNVTNAASLQLTTLLWPLQAIYFPAEILFSCKHKQIRKTT